MTIMLILSANLFAQAPVVEWETLLGDSLTADYGRGAFQTADGGYIVGGNCSHWNGGYYDNVLFKLNTSGDTLWSAANTTADYQENAECFRLLADGTYIFSGYSNENPEAGTAYLYCAESDGSYGWTSLNGTDSIPETATCFDAAGDSGYVTMTRFWYDSQYGWDMKLRYLAPNGWPSWVQHYYTEVADYPACINSLSNGGFIVTGYTQNAEYYDYELLMLKMGPLGGIERWAMLGDGQDQCGYWVIATTDGGFLATGYSKRSDGYTKDVYIVKTDSDCVPEWTRTYGFSYHDEGRYCAQTADGGYVIGATCSPYSSFDFWLLRLDANGDTLWTKVIERPENQSLYTLDICDDGGYLLCGNSGIDGGNYDMYVVKLGPETGIDDNNRALPDKTALLTNYPNPFNASTVIRFNLQSRGNVSLKIYDILGREITTLVNQSMEAGHHSVTFDGSGINSGIYFCTMQTSDYSENRKLLLLK